MVCQRQQGHYDLGPCLPANDCANLFLCLREEVRDDGLYRFSVFKCKEIDAMEKAHEGLPIRLHRADQLAQDLLVQFELGALVLQYFLYSVHVLVESLKILVHHGLHYIGLCLRLVCTKLNVNEFQLLLQAFGPVLLRRYPKTENHRQR